MKKSFFSTLCFALMFLQLYAQKAEENGTIKISGFVFSDKDEQPLSFATIHNTSNKQGAISNFEGYFEIAIHSFADSILISYIGYQPIHIPLEKGKTSYQLKLEESVQMLQLVEVKPSTNDYLFDLIIACRQKQNNQVYKSKAYYQLKSYIDNKQIELVENFYNAKIKGYNLEKLNLKAGRVGLRRMNENIFMSLESSRAISLHDLFEAKPWFPIQPLNEIKRKLKKNFYLDLQSKYQDESGDTIIQLELKPKKSPSSFFITNLWINKNTLDILKVVFEGQNLRKHPFLPIFKDDTLKHMDIKIVKTFRKIKYQMVLDHVDFQYQFDYINRNGENFKVNTQAVIHCYDYQNLFHIPFFKYPNVILSDYRKINAFPYNPFFWNYNNELRVNDEIDSNSIFLNDPKTYKRERIFSKEKNIGFGTHESPYISWEGNRVIIKPYVKNENVSELDEYHLKAKIYLDYNQYSDSSHILTKTIFDPYETYFKPELDTLSHCFINIYFDLIEIERRKLEEKISKSDRSYTSVKRLYNFTLKRIELLEKNYFAEVIRGKNRESLLYYNNIVYEELNIDNFKLFKLQHTN